MRTLASETPAPHAPWHLLEAVQDRGLFPTGAGTVWALLGTAGWPVSSTLIRNKTKRDTFPSKLRAWASEAGRWQAWRWPVGGLRASARKGHVMASLGIG